VSDHGAPQAARPTRWALFKSLGVRDWSVLAEAALTLAWMHVALRVMTPARVIGRATVVPAGRARATPPEMLARVAWLVGVAGRHLVPVPCLARSVALARVLARRGAAARIQIGVRTIDGRLEAHAWVEQDGRVINDDEAAVRQYAPFDRPLGDLRQRWGQTGVRPRTPGV